ncbi:NADH dehydrogenase [ubiquinone] 1 beta subcomplex subunit 4 [Macrosteles quadrilineatus]|uniref:NADH dehydrogenase [ubiquinone] 1 beta subcomplex subunit 4 n=1 Tax=Macrosteles quadrilineatus TaxID=74068 RepID=UPI0023E1BF21|nr:NADH dehydrogenase [ubiquinone] 1 beta subcomplex subunit 4 [Macrosteles quadrilineatus]
MVSEDRLKELVEIKNKQRAATKAEYWKQMTNPFRHATGEGGYLFDTGIQRWMAMEATGYNFFKPTPKNALGGVLFIVLPLALCMYKVKTDRDAREQKYRSGLIAYRDRYHKFI